MTIGSGTLQQNSTTATHLVRLGCVSFVNTLPLIDGLDHLADVRLRFSVPSLLVDQLLADEVDVALCSSIDYQRADEPLIVLPAGLLGCDGPTLTVRLYSTVPLEHARRVFCDSDSHTSIALMRILLRELYDRDPEVIEYDAREHVANNRPIDWPETVLLIGDKVVTDSPPAVRYPHGLDLGAAWRQHTGKPFVFALWMARQMHIEGAEKGIGASSPAPVASGRGQQGIEGVELSTRSSLLDTAMAILDRQRRHNIERIDRIIAQHAMQRKWPADLAADYLKQRLTFEFTAERVDAIELFFRKAAEHGLIDEQRPLVVHARDQVFSQAGAIT